MLCPWFGVIFMTPDLILPTLNPCTTLHCQFYLFPVLYSQPLAHVMCIIALYVYLHTTQHSLILIPNPCIVFIFQIQLSPIPNPQTLVPLLYMAVFSLLLSYWIRIRETTLKRMGLVYSCCSCYINWRVTWNKDITSFSWKSIFVETTFTDHFKKQILINNITN